MARIKIQGLNLNRESVAKQNFKQPPYYFELKKKMKKIENEKFEAMLANSCAKYLGE